MVDLGNCTKCQSRLATIQRTKFRLVGDQKILLDEDGKDLFQDRQGRLSGRPAREWVVACSDCGKEHRDHPHQKTLDEAAQKAKQSPPPPPAFMDNRYVELNGMDMVDRRLGALEKQMADQQEQIRALTDSITQPRSRKGQAA